MKFIQEGLGYTVVKHLLTASRSP